MSVVAAGLRAVHERIAAACRAAGRDAAEVSLVAVSKRHSGALVREAYELGHRSFGENRVQELTQKAPELADLTELSWHFIGSLQTNKVRDLLAVPNLAMLHSVDRVRLANEARRRRSGRRNPGRGGGARGLRRGSRSRR